MIRLRIIFRYSSFHTCAEIYFTIHTVIRGGEAQELSRSRRMLEEQNKVLFITMRMIIFFTEKVTRFMVQLDENLILFTIGFIKISL